MMLAQSSSLPKNEASSTLIAPNSISPCLLKSKIDDSKDCDLDISHDKCGSKISSAELISIVFCGENYLVSGVNSNTTCTDLILALLHNQNLKQNEDDVNIDNPKTCRIFHKLSKSQIASYQKSNHHSANLNSKEKDTTTYSRLINNVNEYVILKRLRNSRFEEYLDGGTRVLDVFPAADFLTKSLFDLELRNLASIKEDNLLRIDKPMLSMLSISTDQDSGMGSPMGSSRNIYFTQRRIQRTPTSRDTGELSFQEDPVLPMRNKQFQQSKRNTHGEVMKNINVENEKIRQKIYLSKQKVEQILKIKQENHRSRRLKVSGKKKHETDLKAFREKPDTVIDKLAVEEQKQDVNEWNKFGNPHSATHAEFSIGCWLQQIYALNDQLRKEEQQILRLQAKVRKHQMRLAYHTKDEVLLEIDHLDIHLANKANEIHRVERQLLETNDELKAKLGVLESLGKELEVIPLPAKKVLKNAITCTSELNYQLSRRMLNENDLTSPYFKRILQEESAAIADSYYLKGKGEIGVEETRANIIVGLAKFDFNIKKFGTLV